MQLLTVQISWTSCRIIYPCSVSTEYYMEWCLAPKNCGWQIKFLIKTLNIIYKKWCRDAWSKDVTIVLCWRCSNSVHGNSLTIGRVKKKNFYNCNYWLYICVLNITGAICKFFSKFLQIFSSVKNCRSECCYFILDIMHALFLFVGLMRKMMKKRIRSPRRACSPLVSSSTVSQRTTRSESIPTTESHVWSK